MNKLRHKLFALKIQLNSAYGVSGPSKEMYQELIDTKFKLFKIQKRVNKIKRIYES